MTQSLPSSNPSPHPNPNLTRRPGPLLRFRFPDSHRFYALLIIGLALLVCSVRNQGYFDISDADERFASIRAQLETGSPKIVGPFRPIFYAPIYSIGPGLAALPFFGWADIASAMGLVAMPYRQLMAQAALFSVIAYTAVWMAVMAGIAFHFRPSRRAALAVALVSGLATLVLPYTKSFQSENLTGLCVAGCILCLLRFRALGRLRDLAGAGALYGFTLTIKLEALAVSPLLVAWLLLCSREKQPDTRLAFLQTIRHGMTFSACALPGLLIVLWHNVNRYGSIYQSGYEGQGFTHPFVSGVYLIWLSAGKGLLWYCPVLLFCLAYTREFVRRHRADAWLLIGWWAIMGVLYAKWHSPTGETSLGSRFMVSYLPLGIIPALCALDRPRSRIRNFFGFGLLGISAGIALFCCCTSFVVYHSRRWNGAPNNPVERYRAVWENWYVPAHSPLAGMWGLLKEGLLDFYCIRLAPSEGELIILPTFWFLLSGGIGALLYAYVTARRMDGLPGLTERMRLALAAPVVALALCGMIGPKAPDERGFRVNYQRDLWAKFSTIARTIDIPNFQEDRAFHVMGAADFTVTWNGWIKIREGGVHEFRLDTSNSARLELDGRPVLRADNIPFQDRPPAAASITLSAGWHRFRLVYHQPEIQGRIQLKWKPPGEENFASMRSADPRNVKPD